MLSILAKVLLAFYVKEQAAQHTSKSVGGLFERVLIGRPLHSAQLENTILAKPTSHFRFSQAPPATLRSVSSWMLPQSSSTGRSVSRWLPRVSRDTRFLSSGLDTSQSKERTYHFTDKIYHALLSRRTVNEFAAKLPTEWEDALVRAVEAATFAPNHRRTEPWRFHLLGAESIRRVCELNAEIVEASKGAEAGAKKLARWLTMPGWLVVTCVKSDKEVGTSMDDPTSVTREDYAACCCAVQNLCLSLHADGIGTKWTTGPVNFDPRFSQAVGLPSNEYVVGTVWFGTAAVQPEPPRKRLAVEDVLCRHD